MAKQRVHVSIQQGGKTLLEVAVELPEDQALALAKATAMVVSDALEKVATPDPVVNT